MSKEKSVLDTRCRCGDDILYNAVLLLFDINEEKKFYQTLLFPIPMEMHAAGIAKGILWSPWGECAMTLRVRYSLEEVSNNRAEF